MRPEDLPKVPGSENSTMIEIAREENNGDGGPPAGDLPGHGGEIGGHPEAASSQRSEFWSEMKRDLVMELEGARIANGGDLSGPEPGFHRQKKKELEDMVGEQCSEVTAELFNMITELYGQMVEFLNGKGGKKVLDLGVELYNQVRVAFDGKSEKFDFRWKRRIQSYGISGCGKRSAEERKGRFREKRPHEIQKD